ncbi:MAG: hypothetical protein GX660_18350 [Clostridiaceae bacterium]|nr:hypothetical protein [Clostridiaceae bacterium]
MKDIDKLNDILEAVEGMNLTEKEKSFIKWLSGWENDSVYSFISIVKKARAE